jgi:hypothetical protein
MTLLSFVKQKLNLKRLLLNVKFRKLETEEIVAALKSMDSNDIVHD